jgi:hypothetical protein
LRPSVVNGVVVAQRVSEVKGNDHLFAGDGQLLIEAIGQPWQAAAACAELRRRVRLRYCSAPKGMAKES